MGGRYRTQTAWSTCPPANIDRVTLIAHAGHWLTTIAYFVPVVGFVAWLIVTQIRDRRNRDRGQA